MTKGRFWHVAVMMPSNYFDCTAENAEDIWNVTIRISSTEIYETFTSEGNIIFK